MCKGQIKNTKKTMDNKKLNTKKLKIHKNTYNMTNINNRVSSYTLRLGQHF